MSQSYSYHQVHVDDWHKIVPIFSVTPFSMPSLCLFRGQANALDPLKTSLERHAERHGCQPDELPERERVILDHFRLHAHAYLDHPPRHTDRAAWLAILRHHRGPARLLDFSRSFYVAAFFAMNACDASKPEDPAVWVIRKDAIPQRAHLPLRDKPGLIRLEIKRQTPRMLIQHGELLAPTDITHSFEQNLCAELFGQLTPLDHSKPQDVNLANLRDLLPTHPIFKIMLPKALHREALYDLYHMNITPAALFPGLDGAAQTEYIHLRYLDDWTRHILGLVNSSRHLHDISST